MDNVFKDPYLDRVTVNRITPEILGEDPNEEIKDCLLELYIEEVVDDSDNEDFPKTDEEWQRCGTTNLATVWLTEKEAERLALAILDIVSQGKLERLAVMARNDHAKEV